MSSRVFNPVYDNLHFDLGFPRGEKPYIISLKNTLKHINSTFTQSSERFFRVKTLYYNLRFNVLK